jgi:hypothetical protein
MRLISMGLSNQEITEMLIVAVNTVKFQINSLYGKLGTHRRTQAIVIAREKGLLSDCNPSRSKHLIHPPIPPFGCDISPNLTIY